MNQLSAFVIKAEDSAEEVISKVSDLLCVLEKYITSRETKNRIQHTISLLDSSTDKSDSEKILEAKMALVIMFGEAILIIGNDEPIRKEIENTRNSMMIDLGI